MTLSVSVIVPYYDEPAMLARLLASLPAGVPVVVVDDQSPTPPGELPEGARLVRTEQRGYFAGAVNRGLDAVPADHNVLIVNQDAWFASGDGWLHSILFPSWDRAGVLGELAPVRPGYPPRLHGSIFAIRADVRNELPYFDAENYPHWGGPEHYQLLAARKGYTVAPFDPLALAAWFRHEPQRKGGSGKQTSKLFRSLKGEDPTLLRRLTATPPRVSVVIPVYNKAPYLDETLKSFMASTYQDFQIILVDDASTDGSREIIDRWVDPWSYISAIYQADNSGVISARNTGINAAVGELVYPFDSDDVLVHDGLARMVAAHDAHPDRWIYSDMEMFGHGIQKPYWRRFKEFDTPHPYDIALYNRANAAIIYKKSWWEEVGGYTHECEAGIEDWCLGIQLTLAGHCGQRLQSADGDKRPAFRYRRSETARGHLRNIRGERTQDAAMLRRVFPAIFKGLEERKKPMACCGKSGRKTKPAGTPVSQIQPVDDFGEIILVQYTGKATATFYLRGAATRTRYQVAPGKPMQIYSADARAVLGRRQRDFERYAPPEPAPEPEQPPLMSQDMPVPDPADMYVDEALEFAESLAPENLARFRVMEAEGKARKTLLRGLDAMIEAAA